MLILEATIPFIDKEYIVKSNQGRFCNNNEIDTLISKRLYVENKAKLSQLEIVNIQYCRGGFEFPIERVSLCSLQTIAQKLVYQFCHGYKICPGCRVQHCTATAAKDQCLKGPY